MTKRIYNVKEPHGSGVIRSASGTGRHVAQPRGEEYVRNVVTGEVIKSVAKARQALHRTV